MASAKTDQLVSAYSRPPSVRLLIIYSEKLSWVTRTMEGKSAFQSDELIHYTLYQFCRKQSASDSQTVQFRLQKHWNKQLKPKAKNKSQGQHI